MKRCFAFLFALLLCVSLAFPVLAEVQMVEDINTKAAPSIKTAEDGAAAIVYDAEGNELMRIDMKALLVTALADAASSDQISDDAQATLENAYNKFLNPDAMLSIQANAMNEVAIDVLGAHSTADSFTAWSMFDLTMKNEEVLELLKQEGTYVEITFDVGEEGSSVVASMVYANDEWFNIEMTNNHDGTVTCKFTLFGTVVFLIPFGDGDGETGDGQVPNDPDDDDFVPSIGYKPIPGMIPGAGGIVDKDGNVNPVEPDCFSFISVDETEKPQGSLSEQERILRSVYNVLGNPKVKLSQVAPAMNEVAEKLLGLGHTADDFVIRDLFYMDLICGEHAGMFPAEGVQLKLVFDLGVDPDQIITGMVYVDGEWIPLEATNNGDDTVTFLFDDICPVAFLIPKEDQSSASSGVLITGNEVITTHHNNSGIQDVQSGNNIWMITGIGSLLAAAALTVVYLRGKKQSKA